MKTNFLTDSKGKRSVMRLGFITLLLGGLTHCFIFPESLSGIAIIGSGVGLKGWQKTQEVKK